MYSVFVKNPTTGDVFELPFTKISYIEELNNGGSANFEFDYLAVKEIATKYSTTPLDIFTATFREIWIEKDSVKLWLGVISEYNRTRDADGKYTLTIAAIDYFSVFQKRRTSSSRVFTATDPASIAWTLIDETQTSESPYSDFGITQGVSATTGLSQSITYQFAEIRQEIIKLSNANQYGSFDFDIDYTKKFNTYTSKGQVRSNIYLDDNNILADSVKIPLILQLTNEVYIVGNGVNTDISYVNRQAANSYKSAFKKLEDMIRDPQASDTAILNAEGDRYLSLYQTPIYTLSLKHTIDSLDITTYDIGDTLIVNLPEESINYAQYRVRKRTVTLDSNGSNTVQIDMMTL